MSPYLCLPPIAGKGLQNKRKLRGRVSCKEDLDIWGHFQSLKTKLGKDWSHAHHTMVPTMEAPVPPPSRSMVNLSLFLLCQLQIKIITRGTLVDS